MAALTLPLCGPLPLPQAGEGKTCDEGRRLPFPRAGEGGGESNPVYAESLSVNPDASSAARSRARALLQLS
jgi:hypothetical protein